MNIHTGAGANISVKILRPGDKYGLNDCLTWGAGKWDIRPTTALGIEFYDGTQFVSRYYLHTLLKLPRVGGLHLHGSEPRWELDFAELTHILNWVVENHI